MPCDAMSSVFFCMYTVVVLLFRCYATIDLIGKNSRFSAFLDFPLLSVLRVCCHDSTAHTFIHSLNLSFFHTHSHSHSLIPLCQFFEQLVVRIRYIMFCLPSLMMFAIYIKIQFLDFFVFFPAAKAIFNKKGMCFTDIDCEKIDIA